ncbi:hypothetical protein [Clostridium luticellarii]|uniref:Uncharacterized protein n=1 Tax=Clostridium luticellarii TaxID=1691940 RepID=A0A2T0BNR6_9CLOT|nr:hypothetical protein [Clostridium luticellarii]PRR85538.1 hypothetical protein CLLU_14590 [Clostridium luticellarii]
MNKPHCYGKMNWILKYPEDDTPKGSICSCQYTNSCLRLTRNKAESEICPCTYEPCDREDKDCNKCLKEG